MKDPTRFYLWRKFFMLAAAFVLFVGVEAWIASHREALQIFVNGYRLRAPGR